MACPHVVGVAGLILSKNPDLTPLQVRTVLRSSTDKVNAVSHVGTGRINAYTALVKTAPVVAHLDPSIDNKKIKKSIEIKGITQGEEFNHYTVEYAYGVYPKNYTWTLLANSTTPKEGVLATLNPQSLLEGQYTIRLRVHAGSHIYEDTAIIVVDNNPNTFYVDDDNTGGPWFGTEDQPFNHIQTAIDSCGALFDNVVVNPGVYYESLNIGPDKSVKIHGADAPTTIIQGFEEKSIGLSMFYAKFNTFEGFTLNNCFFGIDMTFCCFNRLFNNIIRDNKHSGIGLLYTLGNMFFDNTFINNSEYNVFNLGDLNLWYNPVRLRGNYWDDYSSRYPDATPRPLLSWSWNTPYSTSTYWRDLPFQPPFLRFLLHNDRFPLVNPTFTINP
jgi:parallel beta-helix repeat protein